MQKQTAKPAAAPKLPFIPQMNPWFGEEEVRELYPNFNISTSPPKS